MKRPILSLLLAAALLILAVAAAPGESVADGGAAGGPEGGLSLALGLLKAGRPGEAVKLLDDLERRYPGWRRLWEVEVLREAGRHALASGPAPVSGAGHGDRPLRAAQVLLFEGGTMGEIEENLLRLREAGVDTVFVRVFHNAGDRPLLRNGPQAGSGVYFSTTAAPVVTDHLARIVPVCRRLGISLYAWMTTRRNEWLFDRRPDMEELAYDPSTGSFAGSRSLNIFHPQARGTLVQLYRDLAAYDIDGILLQDDLVLRAGEGFSPEARAAYSAQTGKSATLSALYRQVSPGERRTFFSTANLRPDFWKWAAWKNRSLLDFAGELIGAAREVRPGLRFAVNLYYETVLNPKMALAWYSQDLEAARDYPFDYFSLMSYHRQMGRELSLSGDEALELLSVLGRRAVTAVGRPERVIMKVQALDWQTSQLIPGEELDRALAAAAPVEGVSLAFVRSLSDPPLDVIRKHFRGEGR